MKRFVSAFYDTIKVREQIWEGTMSKTMKGTLMTLIAGIAWGLSGACGQYLMARIYNQFDNDSFSVFRRLYYCFLHI